MLYGMYVSAAGALANSYQQDVVANNLANADTVAFKRDLALLQSRPTAAQRTGQARNSTALLEGLGGGVFALPTRTDFSPASLDEVGDPYSVALTGKGFFKVQKGEDFLFTRDGRFTLDENNRLVTVTNHYPVLNDQGSPITVDRELGFSISDSGMISQGGSTLAKLGIVDVEDQNQLKKEGDNLYRLNGDSSVHSVDTQVKQGFIEQSGINPTQELVRMIEAQRMYQLNMSMITLQDQTLGLAVSRLGSVSA